MASLNYTERRKLEEFLGMGSGYVLDFSNRTFREFVHDSVGMDIGDPNVGGSGSKAWRLRHFWSEQPDYIVGKLLKDMIESVTVDDGEGDGDGFGAIRYGVRRSTAQKTECMKIADRLLQSAPVAKDITSREIRDWLRKQSQGLQSKLRNTLSSIYRFARVEGLVPKDCDPVKDVGASALSDYEAVDVSPEQAFAILDEIEPPLVRWGALDFMRGTIKIEHGFVDGEIGGPKSLASRGRVEMHKALAAVLLEWRKRTTFAKDEDFIFASERKNGTQPRLGSMISTDYVRLMFAPLRSVPG